MNVGHIKADDEIPLLLARLENTKDNFINEWRCGWRVGN